MHYDHFFYRSYVFRHTRLRSFVLLILGGRRSFIDPTCCSFLHGFAHVSKVGFVHPTFSLRDINMTFGLLPSRRHVTWRDSVSVWVHCLGSKWEWVGILQQSFSVCCALLTSHKNGETVVYGYNPRSVLGSFGVVLMSCKVYFHVVQSVLQNSVALLRRFRHDPQRFMGKTVYLPHFNRDTVAFASRYGDESKPGIKTLLPLWTAVTTKNTIMSNSTDKTQMV